MMMIDLNLQQLFETIDREVRIFLTDSFDNVTLSSIRFSPCSLRFSELIFLKNIMRYFISLWTNTRENTLYTRNWRLIKKNVNDWTFHQFIFHPFFDAKTEKGFKNGNSFHLISLFKNRFILFSSSIFGRSKIKLRCWLNYF